MDQYQFTASVLWIGLGLALLAAATAPLAARDAGYAYALLLLIVATAYTLFFASISGFSIGRFVAAIPVLLTGYALAQGRGYRFMIVSLTGAVATYFAFSWLLTPILFAAGGPNSLLAAVLGAWGIPLYAAIALVVFIWTALNPPALSSPNRGTSR
jgi:hypothetical protein